jgi:prepilin-type N-terminal cleavage/methylation domain-containing protein
VPAKQKSESTRGFTLIEVMVTLAILALLAGVIITQVTPRIFQGQAAALSSTFKSLSGAITTFRQDVGRYPQRLSHLDDPIVATTQFDLCHTAGGYSAATAGRWTGPYIDRAVDPAGLVVGDALITDSLERSPLANPPAFSTMFIVAADVDTAVYVDLEKTFDSTISATTGSIRWTEVGTTNRGFLRYALPVRGC